MPCQVFSHLRKRQSPHRAQGGTWQTQSGSPCGYLISDVTHQQSAIRYLYRLFNKADTTQPGGPRARFIPNKGVITMSSPALGKRFKMLQQHKAVIQSLQLIHTDSIIPTNYSLRHIREPKSMNLEIISKAFLQMPLKKFASLVKFFIRNLHTFFLVVTKFSLVSSNFLCEK